MKNTKMMIFIGMGMELVGLIVACAWLGQLIDKKMSWPGFALAGMCLVGLVSWLIHMVFLVKSFEEDQ